MNCNRLLQWTFVLSLIVSLLAGVTLHFTPQIVRALLLG